VLPQKVLFVEGAACGGRFVMNLNREMSEFGYGLENYRILGGFAYR
jgi:hypothetical protein